MKRLANLSRLLVAALCITTTLSLVAGVAFTGNVEVWELTSSELFEFEAEEAITDDHKLRHSAKLERDIAAFPSTRNASLTTRPTCADAFVRRERDLLNGLGGYLRT